MRPLPFTRGLRVGDICRVSWWAGPCHSYCCHMGQRDLGPGCCACYLQRCLRRSGILLVIRETDGACSSMRGVFPFSSLSLARFGDDCHYRPWSSLPVDKKLMSNWRTPHICYQNHINITELISFYLFVISKLNHMYLGSLSLHKVSDIKTESKMSYIIPPNDRNEKQAEA